MSNYWMAVIAGGVIIVVLNLFTQIANRGLPKSERLKLGRSPAQWLRLSQRLHQVWRERKESK